jgi:hypothetical protein
LVEPQRSNVVLRSQEFDNAGWTKNELTITANNAISPDGTQNADTAFETSVNAYHDLLQFPSVTSGTTYTLSSFVKAAGRDYCYLFFSDGTTPAAVKYNLATGVVLGTALGSPVSSKIENYGNGWYRCSMVYTSGATATATLAISATNSPALSLAPYAGDVTKGISVWGAQTEASSYPTSYIPTTSAAVTRNADVISKTGISALLGTATGSAFVEFTGRGGENYGFTPITLGVGVSNLAYLYVETNNRISAEFYQSTVLQAAIGTGVSYYNSNNIYKAAFAWANNDFVLYINGTQIGTDTSGTAPTPTSIRIGNYNDPSYEGPNINLAALFPTRLTNAELATLTTL